MLSSIYKLKSHAYTWQIRDLNQIFEILQILGIDVELFQPDHIKPNFTSSNDQLILVSHVLNCL